MSSFAKGKLPICVRSKEILNEYVMPPPACSCVQGLAPVTSKLEGISCGRSGARRASAAGWLIGQPHRRGAGLVAWFLVLQFGHCVVKILTGDPIVLGHCTLKHAGPLFKSCHAKPIVHNHDVQLIVL